MSGSPKTARSTANIAFLKYWGATDLERAIPANPSLSMTLESCCSLCTAQSIDGPNDVVLYREGEGELAEPAPGFSARVFVHLDRLRERLGVETRFRIATQNSFPAAAGMASSASGFSALALAVAAAVGQTPDARELSILARLSGSGSATRSASGGYVRWPVDGDAEAPAEQVHPAEHWELHDVIAVVQSDAKKVSSLDGHALAPTSPYFETRQASLAGRLAAIEGALAARDFGSLAPLLEEEAIDLHLIAMSSRPPVFYWNPHTLTVLQRVRDLRASGIEAASTMDAGANVHVICAARAAPQIARELGSIPGVQRVIRDRVGSGPRLVDEPVV